MPRLNLPLIADAAQYESHFKDGVWREAAAAICARHGLPHNELRRAPQGENIIFFGDERFAVKIFAPFRESYARETAALEFALDKIDIKTPGILYKGELEGWSYLVLTRLKGLPATEVWAEVESHERLEIVARLGAALKSLHGHGAPLSAPALNRDWRGFIERQAETCVARQRACGANAGWLERLPAYVAARLELLPAGYKPVLLHGDVHLGNLLLARNKGGWEITGLLDFGDSFCGFHEYDFVAPGVLMLQGNRELQRAFLLAYGYRESHLDMNLRARLMLLTVLYECSNLRKYALRLKPESVHYTLDELEAAIWTFAAE
ncbi:MAG TPA: aminoglycoside phosphotransferase family protein [Pyrinomonadaceae bacterium]|jgi:hygromycin-B 7''-O-kinase